MARETREVKGYVKNGTSQLLEVPIPDNGTYHSHTVIITTANPQERDRASRDRCWEYSESVLRGAGGRILSASCRLVSFPPAPFAPANWLGVTFVVAIDFP